MAYIVLMEHKSVQKGKTEKVGDILKSQQIKSAQGKTVTVPDRSGGEFGEIYAVNTTGNTEYEIRNASGPLLGISQGPYVDCQKIRGAIKNYTNDDCECGALGGKPMTVGG